MRKKSGDEADELVYVSSEATKDYKDEDVQAPEGSKRRFWGFGKFPMKILRIGKVWAGVEGL